MKKLLLSALLGISSLSALKSQDISTIRGMAVGANVTIKGVAANGSELGVIRYIQDNTGGIPAYGGTLTSVNKGDSIHVTGTLKLFQNLLELDPITGYTVISTNRSLPTPLSLTPNQLSEANEGSVIKISNCTFSSGGTFPASATNYTVNSGGQTFVVRSNTLISGTSIPTGSVNITGIASQYCTSPSSGCTTGYQVLIRNTSDFSAVTVTTTTGLNEVSNNAMVYVFPNPANETISFRLSTNDAPQSVMVTDISGRVILSEDKNANTTLVVGDLPKGIYMLTVTTNKNTYRTKFIKN